MGLITRNRLGQLWNVPHTSELFKTLDGVRVNGYIHYEESLIDRFMAGCEQNFHPPLTLATLYGNSVRLVKVSEASHLLGNQSLEVGSVIGKPEVLYIRLSKKIHRICSISLQSSSQLLASGEEVYDKNRLCAALGVAVDRLDPAIRSFGLGANRARNHRLYFAVAREQVVEFVATLSTIPMAPEELLAQLESGTLEIVPPHLAVRRLGVTKLKFAGIFFRNQLTGLRIPGRQNYQAILGVTEQSLQDYLRTK